MTPGKGNVSHLLERAQTLLPGGCWNSAYLDHEVDTVLTRGSGSRVWDVDGNEYIDCVCGSGPMVLGHARPEVVEALIEAVQCPSNYYLLNDRGLALAEEMVSAIPCAEQMKFGITGTDATFFALRLARAFTGRSKVLKFEGGFLGSHDYALISMAPATMTPFPQGVPDSAGIPVSVQQEVLVAPYNDLAATLAIIEEHAGELAAVIVEPQQRCIEPAAGFLEGLREITARLGIVLIFDEVVTGFRLSYAGAQGRYGVIPDLATYGKIIGGGLPLSAVAGRADIMDTTNPRKAPRPSYANMSSTMSGNPIAATAGLATLRVLQGDGVYEQLFATGARFRTGANEVFKRRGLAAQALGNGPVSQFAFTDQEILDYRTSIAGDGSLARPLNRALVSRGILTHGKFYFSLAHTEADVDQIVCALDEAVAEVMSNR